jgi:hypothetical protein
MANGTRVRPRERSIENSSRSEGFLLSTVTAEIEEEDEVSKDEIDVRERAKLLAHPWWKRPSPWWSVGRLVPKLALLLIDNLRSRRVFFLAPLRSIATGAILAPRVEIITILVCGQLRPEYTAGHGIVDLGIRPLASFGIMSESVNSYSSSSNVDILFGVQQHPAPIVTVHFKNSNGTVPPTSQYCKTDPVVQAAVARLQASKFILSYSWLSYLIDYQR